MSRDDWNGRKVARLAAAVVEMYGPTCWLCGGAIDLEAPRRSPAGLSVDHVVPRSAGGGHDLANLRPAHYLCNLKRGNRPARRSAPLRSGYEAPGWPGINSSA